MKSLLKHTIMTASVILLISTEWICASTSNNSALQKDEEKIFLKFKLGFEFQEASHLCLWNTEKNDFQNKKIFLVKTKDDTKLWKVVIDTFDVEFVTYPLPSDHPTNNDDTHPRFLCLESLQRSLYFLQADLSKSNKKINKSIKKKTLELESNFNEINEKKEKLTTLEEVQNKNSAIINGYDEKIKLISSHIKTLEDALAYLPKETEEQKQNAESFNIKLKEQQEVEKQFFNEKKDIILISNNKELQKTKENLQNLVEQQKKLNKEKNTLILQKPQITFQEWIDDIRSSLKRYDLILETDIFIYEQIKNQFITLPRLYSVNEDFWTPYFSPQMTIQHSLNVTIPLYFYLFQGNMNADFVNKLRRAVPYLNDFRDNEDQNFKIEENLYSSLNGFLFLHGTTLAGVADSNESDDTKALKTILDSYNQSKQIDTKMNLFLMSRRSYSDMYNEVEDKQSEIPYNELFKSSLITKNDRFRDERIEQRFNNPNYAEQFFNEYNEPKDLRFISKYLKETFYNKNKKIIDQLLKVGIITTGMIQNFQNHYHVKDHENVKVYSLFKDYFNQSLESVTDPSKRMRFSVNISSQNTNLSLATGTFMNQDNVSLVRDEKFDHDTISPFWLSDLEDSVGRLSRATPSELDGMSFDLSYGSAVTEVRSMSHISLDILKPINEENNRKPFLTSFGQFSQDVKDIFEIIEGFQTQINDVTSRNKVTQIILDTLRAK